MVELATLGKFLARVGADPRPATVLPAQCHRTAGRSASHATSALYGEFLIGLEHDKRWKAAGEWSKGWIGTVRASEDEGRVATAQADYERLLRERGLNPRSAT